jgi:crossover junction endodeoxyribonuclease RuvC
VLGLDPGSLHTGYGVIDVAGSRIAACAVGRISCKRSQAMPDRLGYLSAEANLILERWRPDIVVLESLFRGINTRSLIVLAQARGALLAAVAGSGAEIREFSPAEIKSAVTGNGRADKEQVARMVQLLLTLDRDDLASDATDALAAAICCARRLRMDRLAEGAPVPRRPA